MLGQIIWWVFIALMIGGWATWNWKRLTRFMWVNTMIFFVAILLITWKLPFVVFVIIAAIGWGVFGWWMNKHYPREKLYRDRSNSGNEA